RHAGGNKSHLDLRRLPRFEGEIELPRTLQLDTAGVRSLRHSPHARFDIPHGHPGADRRLTDVEGVNHDMFRGRLGYENRHVFFAILSIERPAHDLSRVGRVANERAAPKTVPRVIHTLPLVLIDSRTAAAAI